ncbi:hypothetical protein C819_01857 [Lachnospiraceae bacterium 10-1]|jgi:hypothetical protein|nr:hypothetical protein C819_01857 [Lachnospiraceae bacterium 10-1]
MDKEHYNEMVSALNVLEQSGELKEKKLYLFGHCNATEELAGLLIERQYKPTAILDNNTAKHGKNYRNIPIEAPQTILSDDQEKAFVCIVARAYAAMASQLKGLGYKGQIRKLVDYNSYAEYSLSEDTRSRMKRREVQGEEKIRALKKKYPGCFVILCPFAALGDIYFCMSYLQYFLEKRNRRQCVIGVIGSACAQVVNLFGENNVEVFSQKDMDEMIQAALFTKDADTFIPHQDRPYVVDLSRALYGKLIPLEQIYCCGVFGFPQNTKPVEPSVFKDYPALGSISEGKAVILSPYAKSVTALPESIWRGIVEFYIKQGYKCYTNVAGDERPLEGTEGINPSIAEIKSVVERAGTFIGIRSGLCDVLRTARAKKTALYPDYNYCDTQWKAIDMYALEGWDNRVVKDDFVWRIN